MIQPMKNTFNKSPYAATAATFLAMLAVGYVFWGWRAMATAYCLLLYCIVAVAIKLDDITRRLDRMSEQLRRLAAASVVAESPGRPDAVPPPVDDADAADPF